MMEILATPIIMAQLHEKAQELFLDMVKAVVDVDKELIAINAELHSDLETLMLENGSSQESLWGINLYPQSPDREFVEFDSLINIRPAQGNLSRGVKDPLVQDKVKAVVAQWIKG